MITGISGFGFFLVQKWPFRDSKLFSKKWVAETPIFIVFLGARFFGQVVKKGDFGHPPKIKKKLTDNWKALFLVLLCFLLFFLCCFFLFLFSLLFFLLFCVFFGGFKGQVTWPEGPPHLALNPPYFFFVSFFFVFVFFCFGFKGQVRWPKGPPHLALNPPYLLFFCFFVFPFFTKNLVFPPRKGHLCLFLSVSLSFSLAFFGLPLFQIFFLCLSLLLVLFSSFLSFFFAFFCFLFFVSFFHFLSSLLLFREKNNIKIFNYKVFLHQSFLFFGCLSSFLFEFLSLHFSWF